MNDPKRILIVRLSHLGDVACTLGLLHALHEAYPGARIAWAIQEEFAPLIASMPALERTIHFERHGGLRAWLRVRKELLAFAPDWVVDAQGNLKSAAITWLAGAKHRVGFDKADWREKAGHWVVNDPAPAKQPGAKTHLVQRVNDLIAHCVGSLPRDLDRTASVHPHELRAGHQLLDHAFGSSASPILLSLSQPEDLRSWPVYRWAQLLGQLADQGRPVLILQGPGEQECALALQADLPELEGLRHWASPMDLRSLVGLMLAATERGSSFLGVDSGPMHLAWGTGLPVLLLEGPCAADRTGPWPLGTGAHRVLHARERPHCAPCFRRTCNHAQGNVCMSNIMPGDVLAQLP